MQLRVKVRNIRHLPKMDAMGKCDPYVVLTFGSQKHQTAVKNSVYDPDYDEEFSFILDKDQISDPLTLDLMDWDRLTEHDYIGSVQIDLNDVIRSLGEGTEGAPVDRVSSVTNMRDSTHSAVKGHDGTQTKISLSFSADDDKKTFLEVLLPIRNIVSQRTKPKQNGLLEFWKFRLKCS
jgi:hypothetical protein